MNNRSQDYVKKYGPRVLSGTIGSSFSTMVLMPAHYIVAIKQTTPATYPEIVRDAFSREGVHRIYSAKFSQIKTVLVQSFAFLGVGNLLLEKYKEDYFLWRGLKAGAAVACVESLTGKFQHSVMSAWSPSTTHVKPSTVYIRSMEATFLKSLVSCSIAFISYLYVNEQIKKLFKREESPTVAASAGLISALCFEILNTPLSTLQSLVLKNPDLPLWETAVKAYRQSPLTFFRGGIARIGYKGLQSGISFGIAAAGNQFARRYE